MFVKDRETNPDVVQSLVCLPFVKNNESVIYEVVQSHGHVGLLFAENKETLIFEVVQIHVAYMYRLIKNKSL